MTFDAVTGAESTALGVAARTIRVACPKCKAEQSSSVHAASVICRTCGHYFQVVPLPSKRGLGSLLSRWLEGWRGSAPPRADGEGNATGKGGATPTFRPDYQVEPFYGTEDYVAGPEEPDFGPSVADAVVEALEFESTDPEDLDLVVVPGISTGGFSSAGREVNPSMADEESGTRVVRCLDCKTEISVEREASSVLCRRCGCQVSLENHDIRGHVRESIRTRGNITIHRRSSLSAGEIACDSLKVYGKISGKIECSGDVLFRSSGKVVGALRCRHIHVHKLCNLKFVPGIRAETAEIHGHVEGDIICEGTIRITKTGAVFGDCIAPTVSLEDGATLAGRMRFMKPDLTVEEEYARRAEEAQEVYFETELEADLEAFKRVSGSGGVREAESIPPVNEADAPLPPSPDKE